MVRQSQVRVCGVVLLAVLAATIGRPGDARAQEPAEASAGQTCDAVLTREEAVAIVGDSYAGPAVDEPRPGFTRCEWQGNDSNFTVTYANARSLKEDMTTADATFEMDVSAVETDERKRELLPGIGQKAAVVSLGDDAMLLEVARGDGVARVVLYKVDRDKVVSLGRALAEP
jgi:hypothetical protein